MVGVSEEVVVSELAGMDTYYSMEWECKNAPQPEGPEEGGVEV